MLNFLKEWIELEYGSNHNDREYDKWFEGLPDISLKKLKRLLQAINI